MKIWLTKLVKNRTFWTAVGLILGFFILLLISTKGFTINGTTWDLLEKNKIFIQIGSSFKIVWYAVYIVYGIVSAVILSLIEGKKHNLNPNYVYDGLLIIVPVCLIGLRVWSLAFDDIPGNFFRDFFNFADGGLAIHGAIVFGFIGILIYCYLRKISFLALMDIVVVGFLVGQIIGRWGNFMNGEVYGRLIEGVKAPTGFFVLNNFGSTNVYHPLFLYEGLWNFVGLIAVLIVRKKTNFLRIGDILGFYLVWYGVGRAWMEPLRSAEYQLDAASSGLQISTIISIVLIVTGILLVVLKYVLTRKKPLPLYKSYQFQDLISKKKKEKSGHGDDVSLAKEKPLEPEEYMKTPEYLAYLAQEEKNLQEEKLAEDPQKPDESQS
ncbi:MAG: prolipoprotein diacylglyceryl transferase [Acholeplasmatales bacterium]|jgi:phosphatidylglycerol:prolipoprotein diacylglycerol transferase|nr:prolipoprotein diacylglyceryl transferase [Acholeplasmatales bacterium]